MQNRFELRAERTVSESNYCFFRSPIYHPDRVMREHDLIFLLEGEWEIVQGDETFLMEPGDVLILHAGQHHRGPRLSAPGTKTMYAHISAADDCVLPDTAENGEAADHIVLPSLIHCGNNSRVRRLFADLVYYFHADSDRREDVISSTCRLLFCELSSVANNKATADVLIYRTIRMIQQNPSGFYTSQDLAAAQGQAERSFRNRFVSATGQTPRQFQMSEKIRGVIAMMEGNPSITLAELAYNFGFFDEFHLSRSFKKEMGISPSEYRKIRRTKED